MAQPEEEWVAPWPYGYPDAVESAGTVASPLLAGFSFALIGLIVPEGKGIRWPGVALALFVAAGLLFIAAVQCGFWARQWTIKPGDLEDWRPDDDKARRRAEQRLHARGFECWSARLRFTYRGGLLGLLGGVVIVLVPPGNVTAARWLAIAIASLGWLLEVGWIVSGWILKGSPIATYRGGQPDAPTAAASMLWLRRLPLLRWIARKFVPLITD